MAQLEQQLADTVVTSPLAGLVTGEPPRPASRSPGAPIAVLTDVRNAWLSVYVPEPDLDWIQVGQESLVRTDGGAERRGRVTFVASQAEFTPKNVQTRDERVKLVFSRSRSPSPTTTASSSRGCPPRRCSRARGARAELRRDPRQRRSAPSSDMNESNEPTAPALVEVRDLVRHFGTVTAVDGASFTVAKGEMFGLIGPDGAGKSTTLRTILGLLVPDAGGVRACGLHPIQEGRALAGRVGCIWPRASRSTAISPSTRASLFFAEVHDVRRWKPRHDELLELLKMARFRTRLADRLSGGMETSSRSPAP
ncbi:MAG: ATP-binding cassette domain-containing protein [bacterium]